MDRQDHKLIFGVTAGWFYTLLIIIISALIITGVSLAVEGKILSIQYQNVKHSQGYVESHNDQMRMLIVEYRAGEVKLAQFKDDPAVVEAVTGQMTAILNDIRAKAGELSQSEVAPDVNQFLIQHGN